MKKFLSLLLSLSLIGILSCNRKTDIAIVDMDDQNSSANATKSLAGSGDTITVFNDILFYTGYDELNTSSVPDGVQRINNALYVKKLSNTDLSSVGDNLKMEISIKAACDNYDRIGRVYLSLIKKGEPYSEDKAKNIEVGRFITPFVDKNKSPNLVPYIFNINNLSQLIRDATIRDTYDIWIGFSIFGVSYAAQNQIAGCKGNNSTFFGTLKFSSTQSSTTQSQPVQLHSLSYIKMSGDGNDNELNYLNKTPNGAEKSISVSLDKDLKSAKLYLITSNHGANSGGEEYVRRVHNIYFDDQLKLTYTPGGKSCEPFRKYNTQVNQIYSSFARTDAQWASFSNWCPGDAIPIRTIELGDLKAGDHTFKILVEKANFAENQGYIPVSAYLQGTN